MPAMPEPVFEESNIGDRPLVTCAIGEFKGAARVFSSGLDKAKDRAKHQAETLWKRANPE